MWKLDSLRRLILQAVPKLAENPENLIVRATGGQVLATGADSLSYEYLYTAEITVLDYAGHADALFVPLVAWLRVNQSDALDNADKRQKALLFDVEQLNDTAADVGIRVPLREAVIVKPDPDHPTRYSATHPKEPCHPGGNCVAEHWELYLKDQKLCEWDIDAPPERTRFEM